MLLFVALGVFILSVVLNILRIYYVRKRGYFLTHKSKKYEKFEKELDDIINHS